MKSTSRGIKQNFSSKREVCPCFKSVLMQKRDRPRFKPHVFPEFWQKWNFIFHKKRKPVKTHGSCKHNVYWCINLTARDRDRPRFTPHEFTEFRQKS